MEQLQKDPAGAMRTHGDNAEMREFLQAFMKLMGEHFTKLADKQEAEQREAAQGVTGGLSEHTQLLMDAGEAELRGFRPDEEVVMPLPVWSDSDED